MRRMRLPPPCLLRRPARGGTLGGRPAAACGRGGLRAIAGTGRSRSVRRCVARSRRRGRAWRCLWGSRPAGWASRVHRGWQRGRPVRRGETDGSALRSVMKVADEMLMAAASAPAAATARDVYKDERSESGQTYQECLVLAPGVGVKGLEDGVLVCEGADAVGAGSRRLLMWWRRLGHGNLGAQVCFPARGKAPW